MRPPFDWDICSDIDLLSFSLFLQCIPHSAPGPDGIPYLAWRLAGEKGARALYDLFKWLSVGNPPSRDFVEGLMVSPLRVLKIRITTRSSERSRKQGRSHRKTPTTRLLPVLSMVRSRLFWPSAGLQSKVASFTVETS